VNGDNPFQALGLPARADLSDDEVRAAWRRIAAATHPDRADGGDGPRFAAAAAAYAALRTAYGRGEAYADLRGTPADTVTAHSAAPPAPSATPASPAPPADISAPTDRAGLRVAALRLMWRLRHGRPAMLALRFLVAVAVCWTCVAVAGWQPATLAIGVGALTWLIRTTRYDLAPGALGILRRCGVGGSAQ
jgi:hypothetical protein